MNRLTPYFAARVRRGAVVSPSLQAIDEPCVSTRAHGAAGHFPAPPPSSVRREMRLLTHAAQLAAVLIASPLLVLLASAVVAVELAALALFVPGILWRSVRFGRMANGHD